MTSKDPHVARFVEETRGLAEDEGLPRTAGCMMGLLGVAGAELGIDEP